MNPKFTHDCDSCKFIGRSMYGYGDKQECDFYICNSNSGDYRSIIARYGNKGQDYASGALFICVELTPLDWFVLSRGIELEEKEVKRLAKLLLNERKGRLSFKEYKDYNLCPEENEDKMFGNEDWMNYG